jgi:hypothetical protein
MYSVLLFTLYIYHLRLNNAEAERAKQNFLMGQSAFNGSIRPTNTINQGKYSTCLLQNQLF